MIKRIYNFEHYFISDKGEIFSTRNNSLKQLKPYQNGHRKNTTGYYQIDMYGKRYKIHRLVAEHFIPNTQNKPQVNHIDGNKLNNIVENLEWVTCSENILHAYKNKLIKTKTPKNASLTYEQAKMIREEYNTGNHSHRSLAKKYNVSKTTIGDLLRGKYYKLESVTTIP